MIRFLLASLLLLSGIGSQAQQNHFVYLQTDNKQPFYIKINNQLLSSTSSGYIIIPKLQNGAYDITVGFPKSEWPQQVIPVKISDADLGFMLKNFGDKGWGLFNMQSLNVIMASSADQNTSNIVVEKKTDGFSNVLADVVNTPALKENKKEVVTAEVVTPPVAPPIVSQPIPVPEKVINPVSVISTVLDSSGRSLVYIDKGDSISDTVKIFIPYNMVVPTATIDTISEKKATETSVIKKTDPVEAAGKEDNKFLNIELPNPNATKDSVKAQAIAPAEVPVSKEVITNNAIDNSQRNDSAVVLKPLSTNSDCKNLATDNDFMKLRKKMAAENNDDKMIAVAKKLFKSNCFSTEQIKNLSVLFLKDEGRYRFFDAAYPFVYDSQNFSTLQSQLTDEYQINRFKAMIRH